MSENKTIIIVRNPGSDIPEEYLRKVLKEANSCGGYAVQTKDDTGSPMIISDRVDSGLELEAVQELLKGYADERVLLAFSKLQNVTPKSMQPFDLAMDGDSAPLMSYALEGDFPSMAEGHSTAEETFSTRVLDPSFKKFLRYSGGELDKFIEELKDVTFVDNIMSRIGDRGQFAFLPPVGDAIYMGKNKLSSFFPWGFVSNTLGYTEEAPKKPVEVTTKKTGWWGKKPVLSLPNKTEEPKPVTTPSPPVEPEPSHVKDAPLVVETPQDTSTPPKGEWKEVPGGTIEEGPKGIHSTGYELWQ